MPIKKENKTSNFSKISIGLASPEEILENSSGEVLKPETINYRTYKPEREDIPENIKEQLIVELYSK